MKDTHTIRTLGAPPDEKILKQRSFDMRYAAAVTYVRSSVGSLYLLNAVLDIRCRRLKPVSGNTE